MTPGRTYIGLKLAVSFKSNSPGETIVVVWIALKTFINPAPCCVNVCRGSLSLLLDPIGCAVVSKRSRADLATATVLPLEAKSNAELPAMKGVAMDVPDRTAKEPSGTGKVEMIFPPGAATAGLKNISFVGP